MPLLSSLIRLISKDSIFTGLYVQTKNVLLRSKNYVLFQEIVYSKRILVYNMYTCANIRQFYEEIIRKDISKNPDWKTRSRPE